MKIAEIIKLFDRHSSTWEQDLLLYSVIYFSCYLLWSIAIYLAYLSNQKQLNQLFWVCGGLIIFYIGNKIREIVSMWGFQNGFYKFNSIIIAVAAMITSIGLREFFASLLKIFPALDSSIFIKSFNGKFLSKRVPQNKYHLASLLEEMSAIFQAIPDLILHIDNNYQVTNYNNNQASLSLNLPNQEVLDKKLFEILPAEVFAKYKTAIAQAIKTQTPVTFDYKLTERVWEEARLIPWKSNQILAVVRNISEHKLTEEALRTSEEQYRRIVETAGEGIWQFDRQQNTTFANSKIATMLGYNPEDMLGKSIFEFMDRESQVIARERLELCRKSVTKQQDFKFKCKDGSDLWAIVSCSPIYSQTGEYIGALAMVTDISKRKITEKALSQTEATNRAIIDGIPDLLLRVKRDGTCLNFIPPKDSSARNYVPIATHLSELLTPEILQKQLEHIDKALTTKEVQIYEHQLLKYNRVCYEEIRISPCGKDEVLIIVRDITERKEAEEKIHISLKEKEVLLKEIHHRVKNNLHVIASLLHLQAHSINDPNLLGIFHDSQNRIHTMALIHEQLYQSENLGKVNLGKYIKRLINNLCTSFNSSNNNIELVVEAEPLSLNLETAIPCGLIINELVTNAYKHAFPNGRSGEVKVQLFQAENQKLHLIVVDNGIGIPGTVDWQNPASLGLKLVQILAKQLKANLELDFQIGTFVKLTFQQLEYKPRI
ncbi:PAS domain S-box protein [Aerosakkonemataceae cyanobacterium BLCC-F154]|uniref:histidine kinase n=1 Tax=Floridaenema fluviatile BLCC-F154 TaxID=3153640 RepID=A0ABV4YFU9_9CYAN